MADFHFDDTGSTKSRSAGSSISSPATIPPGQTKLRRCMAWVWWYLKEQWFLLALALVIMIASQTRIPKKYQAIKATIVSYTCISIIFLITGLTLPTRVLLHNSSRWKIHLFVQVQCFLMTSAVIYGIVCACATNSEFMDPGLLIGLVVMGCTATTLSSNVVMTRQAHGNSALTVVQSTLGNFLSPFLTPLLISMYFSSKPWYTRVLPPESGGYGEVYRRVFKLLGLTLFLPIFVGQIVRSFISDQIDAVFKKYKLAKLSSISLLVILWSTYDQAFASGAFTSVKGSNMVFIVFISIALYLLFLGVCWLTSMLWLPRKDTIAICYCVPAKSPVIGVPMTSVIWAGLPYQLTSKIQIPIVIYQGLQIAAGSLLTTFFRAWAPDEEESKPAEDDVHHHKEQV